MIGLARRFILGLGLLTVSALAAPPTWYVSPAGNDAWSGTLPTPNAAGTDGPKASLAAARDASRTQPEQARRIVLGPGRFYMERTLILDTRDSKLGIEGAGQGKTIIYGGRRLTGWVKADGKLWSAKLPADLPKWSFRVLVVNDAIQDRARLPETGYLEHESTFPVRWMSTAGGGWERKPTMQEYTTMRYQAGDLPADLRIENAEVTVSHMWDESTVGLAKHDAATRTLTFAQRSGHPAGSFNVKRYLVWNTKEGMTRPGQWYLDRVERKVYYWPKDGTDMAKALVVAPLVETLIKMDGQPNGKHVADVALRDLTLSVTDAPLIPAGFGASKWPGVVGMTYADQVVIDGVEVANVGAWAIREWAGKGLVVSNSQFHHLGGGGVRFGSGARIEGCQIHHIGLVSASSIGIMGGGLKSVIRRNVIHDTPYSGMSVGGTETLIEENLIYRCMLVHHDGAAIYMGGGKRCIIRRNLARDMVQIGKGYGVSAYYLDEKCQECVVAENVAIDVPHPSQNHMTLNCELRDNVFITEGDMKIAFSRCSGQKVSGNTFHLGGKLTVYEPDAITEWNKNLLFVRGEAGGKVLEDVPRKPFKPREKPKYQKTARALTTPTIDGKMADGEWPGGGTNLHERTNQRSVRGAPTSVKAMADDTHLYILANIVAMFPSQRKLGTVWGEDEGIELVLQDKKKTVYVLRGFTDGTLRSLSLAGATPEQAEAFATKVKYGASVDKRIWRSEWSVPLAALGIKPGEKTLQPFNLTAYRSEDDVLAQFAGTLGETWELKRGGLFMLNWGAKGKAKARPVIKVPSVLKPPPGAWPGDPIALAQTPGGVPLPANHCSAQIIRSGEQLLVRVTVPTGSVTKGAVWRTSDGAEVCIAGKYVGKPVTWVIRGYPDGTHRLSDEAGAPAKANAAVGGKIVFRATVTAKNWQGEWRLPLPALGIGTKGRVPFNLGVFRSEDGQWINWIGAQGPTWRLEKAGELSLK